MKNAQQYRNMEKVLTRLKLDLTEFDHTAMRFV